MADTTAGDWQASYSSNHDRYYDIDQVLNTPGPRTDPAFLAGDGVKDFLRNQAKILVIGAGGLGCEILANLALTGFKDIHVIDMDTIDISNLNRQFLFRQKDVGKPKATVAAEFIMKRVPGVKVTPYFGKIQDKDDDYYLQFNLVICGLDSVEARRWMSATLVNLGQARVILPTITSCYECSLDMLNKPTAFPICTIANTPRLPEHCIEWASVLEWPRVHGGGKWTPDDPEHIGWLYTVAAARAKEFNIEGVTWSLTQGVVKNIIPAIASTNAIIAVLRPTLNNYFMLIGTEGVYSYTFEHEKRDDCPVCGGESLELSISSELTVEQLIELLVEKQDVYCPLPQSICKRRPSSRSRPARTCTKKVKELVAEGGEVTVTSSSLPFSLSLRITYTV
ncbi:NEDD8 activating enzyme [Mycena galericulata]|nr:NEDD8 activating enzyme [Mycena galericulata]